MFAVTDVIQTLHVTSQGNLNRLSPGGKNPLTNPSQPAIWDMFSSREVVLLPPDSLAGPSLFLHATLPSLSPDLQGPKVTPFRSEDK